MPKVKQIHFAQRDARLYPEFDLAIAIFDDNHCKAFIYENDAPVHMQRLVDVLGVSKSEIHKFLHNNESEGCQVCMVISNDVTGALAQIRWRCLTGYANVKVRESQEKEKQGRRVSV